MSKLGLDFETYSDVDLKKHGLDRYLSSPHFMPLIVSKAEKMGPDYFTDTVDFVADFDHARRVLMNWIDNKKIVAQNAGFERGVLSRLEINLPVGVFIDSAVVARAAGGGEHLEAAAAQLLGIEKMAAGKNLIRVFSVPTKYQEENASGDFDPRVVADNPVDWKMFGEYCELDAKLGLMLEHLYWDQITEREMEFQALTMSMCQVGWNVDIDTVEEMQRRYLENQANAVADFRVRWGQPDLNFNSYPQQVKFCLDHGIKARSFDEKHVASMLKKIKSKLDSTTVPMDPAKAVGYMAVRDFLNVKQVLGGSSLSKLATILNTVSSDGRLRDQYVHCGAGQTLRTTGRGVQMQNLKRLDMDNIGDMDELMDDDIEWSNTEMAQNLRQVFTATDPNGFLLVGDFKGVENVGLAWLAGQQDKLDAVKAGLDPYIMLASKMYSLPYESISKDSTERKFGKVGELSCGYQAGAGAVKDFAMKQFDIELTEGEASRLVYDWRDANPKITAMWDVLDDMLHTALSNTGAQIAWDLPDQLRVTIEKISTPSSLIAQEGNRVQSLQLVVSNVRTGAPFLIRVFHGCHEMGRNVRYYKASSLKGGKLWKDGYKHPKTGVWTHYELYGGKISGILTQSFCRELFFHSLSLLNWSLAQYDNAAIVGQFHDEMVVDWQPSLRLDLEGARSLMAVAMSDPGVARSFPLMADIKHAYRYTK